MADDQLQSRADDLATRVEALAEALRVEGIPEEAAARLLARASAAVLQALNLELLTAEAASAPASEPAPAPASYCVVFDASRAPFRTLKAAA